MLVQQRSLRLPPMPRGFHLISDRIAHALTEMSPIGAGVLHLFLCHTSASLTLNENADPDVRRDLEMSFNRIAPEEAPYTHTCEGPDDMPAHVKSSLLGASLLIPLRSGRMLLGTWQGIYLCEHREHGGSRQLWMTAWGSPM